MHRKKTLLTAALMAAGTCLSAQTPVAGTTYFLPKTAVKLHLLIEKTTVTPGRLALYAEKYMKLRNAPQKEATGYRVVGIRMQAVGLPDSAKMYTLTIDKKHIITDISRDENGVLLAVNDRPRRQADFAVFKAAPQQPAANATDFMTEDILKANSSAKMAELIAREIYDIRDSRNQLSRGEADFMPKDGEQLRLMLANLDKQERGLMQVFEGTVQKDTTETSIDFTPERAVERQLLFRFSKKLGLVDADDLVGAPYFVSVDDLHSIPMPEVPLQDEKKSKDDIGLCVNLPGRIRVSLYDEQRQQAAFELYAAQFGRVEAVSGELFSKKQTTNIVLNGVTGNVEKIEVRVL